MGANISHCVDKCQRFYVIGLYRTHLRYTSPVLRNLQLCRANCNELQLLSKYRNVMTLHTWRWVFADTNNLWLTAKLNMHFTGRGLVLLCTQTSWRIHYFLTLPSTRTISGTGSSLWIIRDDLVPEHPRLLMICVPGNFITLLLNYKDFLSKIWSNFRYCT